MSFLEVLLSLIALSLAIRLYIDRRYLKSMLDWISGARMLYNYVWVGHEYACQNSRTRKK